MTRKNLVIDRTFSNRFLRGATDRVALQYRSSRGFSTLEDVKREVASFSNAENFFYVQFRKTWYPVYLLAGAATIVVGKSFFCYGSSAEHKQPYLTYVEKKASNVPEVAHRELGGLSRIYPSICGNTISAALVSDLRTLDGNADLPVMCGSRISALTAGASKGAVLSAFGYAMFDTMLSPFQMDAINGYFVGRPSADDIWESGCKAYHPVTGAMEFSEKRRHIVVNSHSCRAYTLNEWVEDSGNDDYLALVDKNGPAWV